MKYPSMKNFSLQERYCSKKQKWKYYDFASVINYTCKLTCVCACRCACNCMRFREQYAVLDDLMTSIVFFNGPFVNNDSPSKYTELFYNISDIQKYITNIAKWYQIYVGSCFKRVFNNIVSLS